MGNERSPRYYVPMYVWVSLSLLGVVFYLCGIYALAVNIWDAQLSTSVLISAFKLYWPEVRLTLVYAFSATSLQVFLGGGGAILAYYYWGNRSVGTSVRLKMLYFILLPYFVPIVTFAEVVRQWALGRRIPLNGISAWILLITVSVWQFFPFVFLVMFEELQTISPRLWAAVQGEGAGFLMALRYLMLPKLAEIFTAVFLLRFLWMYTKVDLIYYLFQLNLFAKKFINLQLFDSLRNPSANGAPDSATSQRALIMVLCVVALLICMLIAAALYRAGARFLSRIFRRRYSFSQKRVSTITNDREIRRSGFLRFQGKYVLVVILVVCVALPFIVQVYCSVAPSDLIVKVGWADILDAWSQCFSMDSLSHGSVRWCLQSIALAASVGFVYTALMALFAYALVRDSRLSWIGKESALSFVPTTAYSIPVIVVALPICQLIGRWSVSGELGLYLKLVIVHGFYLWAFCLWLSFRTFNRMPHLEEVASISEGATLWKTLHTAVIPAFWRQGVAIFILVFAISFNELIFATDLISQSKYFTIPVGIAQQFASTGEGSSSPASLFVITTMTILIACALSFGLYFALEKRHT